MFLKGSAAFTDTFTAPLKFAWNKLANLINGAIEKMNKLPGVDIKVKLQTFATGGFPEDGWFRASRGEIMGKFYNGQSVVANNNQITESISAAVYKGNQENNQLLREDIAILLAQNQLLTELLNKEVGISYSDVEKPLRNTQENIRTEQEILHRLSDKLHLMCYNCEKFT